MKVKALKRTTVDGEIRNEGETFDTSPENAKRLSSLPRPLVEIVAGQKQEDADVPAPGTPAKKGKAVRISESK